MDRQSNQYLDFQRHMSCFFPFLVCVCVCVLNRLFKEAVTGRVRDVGGIVVFAVAD
jgi:hypothetical protein